MAVIVEDVDEKEEVVLEVKEQPVKVKEKKNVIFKSRSEVRLN